MFLMSEVPLQPLNLSTLNATPRTRCVMPNSCTGKSGSIYQQGFENQAWFASATDGSSAPPANMPMAPSAASGGAAAPTGASSGAAAPTAAPTAAAPTQGGQGGGY